MAVVLDGRGALLVVHRRRGARTYTVLPGGGVEVGESAEQAVLRELAEETGLAGSVVRPLWVLDHPDRRAHYFLVDAVRAAVTLGGPELDRQSAANRYVPAWVTVGELDAVNLQPADVRPLLLRLDRSERGAGNPVVRGDDPGRD